MIALAIVCRRPELETAFPKLRPPAARMMMVQRKLLKSSLVRMPVPKNRTMGMIAITPMSPKKWSSWWEKHQRTMVPSVTVLMNHWTPVKGSLTGRMGTMVTPLKGKVTTNSSQMNTMVIMHTGNAMKNHVPQLGFGSIFCSAIMFCGDAMIVSLIHHCFENCLPIGDAAPPMFDARAIPKSRALVKDESAGRLRRRGYELLDGRHPN